MQFFKSLRTAVSRTSASLRPSSRRTWRRSFACAVIESTRGFRDAYMEIELPPICPDDAPGRISPSSAWCYFMREACICARVPRVEHKFVTGISQIRVYMRYHFVAIYTLVSNYMYNNFHLSFSSMHYFIRSCILCRSVLGRFVVILDKCCTLNIQQALEMSAKIIDFYFI